MLVVQRQIAESDLKSRTATRKEGDDCSVQNASTVLSYALPDKRCTPLEKYERKWNENRKEDHTKNKSRKSKQGTPRLTNEITSWLSASWPVDADTPKWEVLAQSSPRFSGKWAVAHSTKAPSFFASMATETLEKEENDTAQKKRSRIV